MDSLDETQDELSSRYASAMLPITIILGLFAVVGVIGNIAVLVVFTLGRAYRHNNFRTFVICLGIIDLLTSAFLIPAEMAKQRSYFSFGSIVMCKTKCLFNVWAACAAALSLLIVCVDRYRKVCQPFKRQITPVLATRMCVFLSFFLSVVLSIPGAVMCGIKETNMTNVYETNTTVYICATEERFEKHILRYIYKYTFIILLMGMSISCVVMYICIGCQIRKHWGSTPVSFRKDSGKDLNSDYSSDTFGNVKIGDKTGQLKRTESNVSQSTNVSNVSPSPIVKHAIENSRPALVKQGSVEVDHEKAKKKLIKQISTASFSSVGGGRRKSDDASARRRTFSRQPSSFGIRRFPYKTLIWFILTLVFIITYLLYLVLSLKVPQLIEMGPKSFSTFVGFYRLYFINNIINPIVYALLDKKFRDACKNIVPRLKARFSDCRA